MVCEKGSRDKYGLLNWTVAQDTDDIVYYQSYTHEVTTLNIMLDDTLVEMWVCQCRAGRHYQQNLVTWTVTGDDSASGSKLL